VLRELLSALVVFADFLAEEEDTHGLRVRQGS
jgi:hypothetical protein